MRINARLDDVSSRELSYLERETGWSISEIVRNAIRSYSAQFKRVKADPENALKRSGFIGCAEGPSDLSQTYKDELHLVSEKHGYR